MPFSHNRLSLPDVVLRITLNNLYTTRCLTKVDCIGLPRLSAASPLLPGATMQKLTKRAIDALRPQPGRDVFRWCGELRGFGIRTKPSGMRTFLIQYRNRRGQTRRYSLGQYGRVTVEEARREAKIMLAEVARGEDPSEARRVARDARTVADMCDLYLQDAWAGDTCIAAVQRRRARFKLMKAVFGAT